MSKWRNLLRHIFCDNALTLPNAIGPWIDMEQSKWVETWDFFVANDRQFLFQHKLGIWQRYILKPTSRHSYYKEYLESDDPSNFELLRATVKENSTYILVISTSDRPPSIRTTTDSFTFGSILLHSSNIDWFNTSLSSSPSTDHLLAHLLLGTAVAVSDGSYFPTNKVGACAWIISIPDGSEWIK